VTPSFQEELAARTAALDVYRELKGKNTQPDNAYFDDLGMVADNSFLAEYVWTYLHQPQWGAPPENLRLVAFMLWRAEHLTQHLVVTKGAIRFDGKNKAPAKPAAKQANDLELLRQGGKVMQDGDERMAIAGYYDPVIEYFERTFRGSDKRVDAARNQMQALLYAVLPENKGKSVEVLNSTWADAWFMKAYALEELHQLDAAGVALERAMALSPMASLSVAERAYLAQVQGGCDRSIELYKQAESVAGSGSDETTKTEDLTRAWRGQGYCLTEQGRLDEAEALYKKSLQLDPADTKAKNELEYIRQQRAKAK
jgi:tetratricopeptide (TPR) repeat protein